ncbi:hypothetical protein TIFTF001_032438 [Ficus carica]|uniref:RNase H type-1 domain-containing protein n=1 Tax=Ficus carica TaxID=3494 RepID=A0AA88J7X7_FICCA|nr:hypothetical protein TIFTF001_032438 [Ficus carica]
MGFISVEAVICDSDGIILDFQAKKIHGSFSPFMAECLGLREGLLFAKDCGICIQIAEFHSSGLALLYAVKLIEWLIVLLLLCLF